MDLVAAIPLLAISIRCNTLLPPIFFTKFSTIERLKALITGPVSASTSSSNDALLTMIRFD